MAIKICLAARYFDFRNAGLGRVAMEIRDRLIARGHDVRTVSTEGKSLQSYFSYTALEMPFRKPRGCDVYHALTPMEAMWLPTRKLVVTFHDLILCTHPERAGAGLGGGGWRNWVGRNYFATAVSLAQAKARQGISLAQVRGRQVMTPRIVCVSEQTKRDLMTCFGVPSNAIRVIKSGIRSDLEPGAKPDGKFKIGYLGQLDRRKRVDLLIGSFQASKIDAELVIAGMGVEDAMLRRIADGDPCVKFLGLIPDDELCAFYQSIDLFVFPTFIEGFGLPAVEAMACKKPVVLLDDVVMPDEIKKRCIVVSDLRSFFAKDMESRIAEVDYEGNYAFAKSHDWEKTVDDYEALYREVAC